MSEKHNRKRAGVALLCALLWLTGSALAHPLGNFTISHYANLIVGAETLRVRYIVDLAEVSTFQELEQLDTNGDRSFSQTEYAAYAARKAQSYLDGLRLRVDGALIALQLNGATASVQRGDGGLPTLRLECTFSGALPRSESARSVQFTDTNENERSGWRELVVTPDAGIAVFDSTAYGNSLTNELRVWPVNAAAAMLKESAAEFSFTRGALPAQARPLQTRAGEAVAVRQRDRLAELIAVPELTWATALLGLLVAAALGGLHALSPGHGKAVVGAYLVGARGTAKHAAFLGLTVTITHTAGVFALGLITLFGSHYVVPEKLFPVLTLLSGATVVAIGLQQLISRWRAFRQPAQAVTAIESEHAEAHPPTQVAYTHTHGGSTHSHVPPAKVTWRNLLALGISGGLLPCPSALVVLLSAIALQRVGYGLLLVVAFSAGLAGVLTGVGLLFLYARRFVERPSHRFARGFAESFANGFARALPMLSALVITCAGAAICYGAFGESQVSLPQFIAMLRSR